MFILYAQELGKQVTLSQNHVDCHYFLSRKINTLPPTATAKVIVVVVVPVATVLFLLTMLQFAQYIF